MENVNPTLVDYSRQAAFDNEYDDSTVSLEDVIIVGCGGIGFWCGILIAMLGKTVRMVLFDKEKIEPTNMNRLPVPQSWSGVPKVVALKRIINTIRPDMSVVAVRTHITEESIDILAKTAMKALAFPVIVDTTDDARAQKRIYDWYNTHGNSKVITYIKMGYEKSTVGAYRVLNAWIPADYRPGYRTTSANAVTSAVAAGMGIYKLLFGGPKDMTIDLKTLLDKPEGWHASQDDDEEHDGGDEDVDNDGQEDN
jgi:molybdopterin/thiamine biosynthesis adenylyltransferase